MEDSLHVLLGRIFFNLRFRVASQHLVEGSDNVEHLILRNESVPIQIVQSKNPLELVLYRSPRHFGQARKEFLQEKENMIGNKPNILKCHTNANGNSGVGPNGKRAAPFRLDSNCHKTL